MANRFWVGGTGTWNGSSTANWSATSGGASGASAPTTSDAVTFDSASGTGTCTTAAGATAASVTINSSTVAVTLGANMTVLGAFTLTLGTLSLGSYILTAQYLASNNSNVRSIAFGTGRIDLTGNNIAIVSVSPATNFTASGTRNVRLTYSGATGTRSVLGATGVTESNCLSVAVAAGTDSFHCQIVNNLDFTGFSGTFVNTLAHTIYGNLTLSATMTIASGTNGIYMAGTTGPYTITTNGVTFNSPLFIAGAGGTFQLADNLTLASTRALTLTAGTFDANGKNVSLGSFALTSGTKTLTLGSGVWTVTGTSWNANTAVAGLTVSASTATITMTSSSAKTFSGGGKSWPTLNQGGSGALTIQQSNSFADITTSVTPATVTLTSGTTQTVSAFTLSGASGAQVTLNASTPGSAATLSRASGNTSVSYLTLSDNNATGGAAWMVSSGVDSGNVSGWVFNSSGLWGGTMGLSAGTGLYRDSSGLWDDQLGL